MNADNYIHVALLGPVSAGKTTLLNALLVERYGDMAMKRTTMTEAIYYESSDEKLLAAADIHKLNSAVNKRFYEKAKSQNLTAADLTPIEHFVPPVHELLVGKLQPGVRLAIHDLPGLNDAQTKAMYHEYVAANFHKYNIIILVLDVNSGMNTSDEKDILTLIANQIKNNKVKYDIETALIVAINKCDDMEIKDHNSGETTPTDPEYLAMVKQVRATIEPTIASCNLSMSNPIRFVCISAEDAYIYRMYSRNPDCVVDPKHRNKFGVNAFGKHTWAKMSDAEKAAAFQLKVRERNADAIELAGFRHLDWKLANLLTKEMQFKFLIAPFRIEMYKIKLTFEIPQSNSIKFDDLRISIAIELFMLIKIGVDYICELFEEWAYDNTFFAQYVWDYIHEYLTFREDLIINFKMIKSKDQETDYAILSGIYYTLKHIDTELNEWFRRCFDCSIVDGEIESMTENMNLFIVYKLLNIGCSFDDLSQNIKHLVMADKPVEDVFMDGEFRYNHLKYLDSGVFDEYQCDGSTYLCDIKCTVGAEIKCEVLSHIWQYNKLTWWSRVALIQTWLNGYPGKLRVNIMLRNLRRYLEVNVVNYHHRWNALDVYSHYYTNSRLIDGSCKWGDEILDDLNKIKKYLHMQPMTAKENVIVRIEEWHEYELAYAVQYCLAELSKLYPKHVVDLDAFYGAPRGGPYLTDFYEHEI